MTELYDEADTAAARLIADGVSAMQDRNALHAELQPGQGLHLLMTTMKADALDAMREFAGADASDLSSVLTLQVRVRTYFRCEELIRTLTERGNLAAEHLRMMMAENED